MLETLSNMFSFLVKDSTRCCLGRYGSHLTSWASINSLFKSFQTCHETQISQPTKRRWILFAGILPAVGAASRDHAPPWHKFAEGVSAVDTAHLRSTSATSRVTCACWKWHVWWVTNIIAINSIWTLRSIQIQRWRKTTRPCRDDQDIVKKLCIRLHVAIVQDQ